jgi:hypothetical protein
MATVGSAIFRLEEATAELFKRVEIIAKEKSGTWGLAHERTRLLQDARAYTRAVNALRRAR